MIIPRETYVVASTFIFCCLNMILLEAIIKRAPSSANLVTFSQFTFITVKGFITEHRFGTRPSHIPLHEYGYLVCLFFVVQTMNNYCLAFDISPPLHMIFRSGSLLASLVLNILICKRRYSWYKHIGVYMVTVGIIACTYASATSGPPKVKSSESSEHESKSTNENPYLKMSIGISMLSLSLFLSAFMGILQERMYSTYGKYPAESLYYNHMLPMPFFVFIWQDLYEQIRLFSGDKSIVNETTGIYYCLHAYNVLPSCMTLLWLLLIANTLSQYLCIKSVFVLTSMCSPVTVTLVLTLRKFVSLIFSILYFSNPFTLLHTFGAVLVFFGTILFTYEERTFSPWRKVAQKDSGKEDDKLKTQ